MPTLFDWLAQIAVPLVLGMGALAAAIASVRVARASRRIAEILANAELADRGRRSKKPSPLDSAEKLAKGNGVRDMPRAAATLAGRNFRETIAFLASSGEPHADTVVAISGAHRDALNGK